MKINMKYILTFFILLIIEIIIAFFIKDTIVRPYIGDILVVILIYSLIKGITKEIRFLPIYVFLFAVIIEISQYYRLIYTLNLQDNKIISTIIGTSFDIKDIFCYLIATVILTIWESLRKS